MPATGDCCESTCTPGDSSDYCPDSDDWCVDPEVLYVCDFASYGYDPEDSDNGMCDPDINNEDCEYDGGE